MNEILQFYSDNAKLLTLILGVAFTGFICFASKKNQQNGRDLLSYIPNIWTSLGILGTFISIYSSLSNIEDKNIDILRLIKEIIPAFSTSIIGILGAIFSSIWIKVTFALEDQKDDQEQNTPEHTLGRIEKNLLSISDALTQSNNGLFKISNSLNNRLDGKMSNIESLLNESIKTSLTQTERITDTLTNQSVILKTFVDDFVGRMNDIFAGMKMSVEQQTRQFGNQQFEASREMMEILQKRLLEEGNSMIQEHTDNTQQILKNNNQRFEEVSKQLVSSIEDLKVTMAESIRQTVDRLKESYEFIDKKAAQIVSNYKQSAESYKDAIQNAHDWNEQVIALLETVKTSIENQKATNDYVSQTLDAMEKRQANIDNLVARIQEMNVAIESLQQLESQLNRLGR